MAFHGHSWLLDFFFSEFIFMIEEVQQENYIDLGTVDASDVWWNAEFEKNDWWWREIPFLWWQGEYMWGFDEFANMQDP